MCVYSAPAPTEGGSSRRPCGRLVAQVGQVNPSIHIVYTMKVYLVYHSIP